MISDIVGDVFGKDKPSPPPAPDYAGAARATSAGTVQSSIANNLMARPNVFTPLGSQTWNQTGTQQVPGAEGNPAVDIPMYSQNINLSPQGQNLYDQQMGLSTGLLGLGQGSLNQTQASLSKPQDFSSVGDIYNRSYGAQTSRLDPKWQAMEGQFENKMANQGIPVGSEAYTAASRDFQQGRNDAYQQAQLAAISTMPQTYQMSTAQRMQPLTELNAIRTGAQPQMPQFQPTQYSMGAQGPNMSQAVGNQGQYAQGLYNAQVGGNNAMLSGLMGLGAAGLMAPTGTFGMFG